MLQFISHYLLHHELVSSQLISCCLTSLFSTNIKDYYSMNKLCVYMYSIHCMTQ